MGGAEREVKKSVEKNLAWDWKGVQSERKGGMLMLGELET